MSHLVENPGDRFTHVEAHIHKSFILIFFFLYFLSLFEINCISLLTPGGLDCVIFCSDWFSAVFCDPGGLVSSSNVTVGTLLSLSSEFS